MSTKPKLLFNQQNVPLHLNNRISFLTRPELVTIASTSGNNEVPYVTDILSFSNSYAALNSESIIKYFDKGTLKTIGEIRAPPGQIIRSIAKTNASNNNEEEALMVTYEDGRIAIYDARLPGNEPRMILKGPKPAPCLCASASLSNSYIASGTELYHHEATIRIHDTRQPGAPLHVYSETHSDDVSTLAFHPTQDHLLLSGAMDGLISTIDVRIPDEDDAILHTANVGASLSRVDWMNLPNASAGNEKTGVWGLTNMETLSVYDASDELSTVKEYGDVREIANPTWQTHYVIDCQSVEGGLALIAGQREGKLAIMQVPLEGNWQIEQILQAGQSDIVRACRLDLALGTAATCGEDGEVCLWSVAPSDGSNNESVRMANGTSSNGGLKATNERETKSARYAPY